MTVCVWSQPRDLLVGHLQSLYVTWPHSVWQGEAKLHDGRMMYGQYANRFKTCLKEQLGWGLLYLYERETTRLVQIHCCCCAKGDDECTTLQAPCVTLAETPALSQC